MKLSRIFIVACLFLLLSVSGSLAQDEDMSGMAIISPMIGGYFFDKDQPIDAGIAYGIGLGYNFTNNWGLEAFYNKVSTEHETNKLNVDVDVYRLDGLYHFVSGKFRPYLAAGLGTIETDTRLLPTDSSFMANYGAGLKYLFNRRIALRADARHLISFDNGDNNFLVTLGMSFGLYGKEKMVAEPEEEMVTEAVAETAMAQGPSDTDGDGVFDDLDKCPGTPRGIVVNKSGCPLDTDGDGVADNADRCPGTPRGTQVDNRGCPLDTDGDGVLDTIDKCPNTPRGISVNDLGCWVFKGLNFDYDMSDIRPEFSADLNETAQFIGARPDMSVEIQGHTDNIGPKAYNQVLSEKRAQVVQDYLIDKGVPSGQLMIKGYNFSKPLTTNDTAEGREINRRVQFEPID